jgi:hypothetical protein
VVMRCFCGHPFWKQSVAGPGGRMTEYGDLDRTSPTYQSLVTACPTCGEVLVEDNLRIDQAMTNAILSNRWGGTACCPGVPPVYHANLWRPSNVRSDVPERPDAAAGKCVHSGDDSGPDLSALRKRLPTDHTQGRPPCGALRNVLRRVLHVGAALWRRVHRDTGREAEGRGQ